MERSYQFYKGYEFQTGYFICRIQWRSDANLVWTPKKAQKIVNYTKSLGADMPPQNFL
jgi:hypothetical protein